MKYSNDHLQPFRYTAAGHALNGADLIVRISFTCHVYSKQDTPGAVEHRFQDEGGKWREFCPTRHVASQDLPQLCIDMITGNFPSWLSKDRNGASNMAVTERMPTSGEKYAVFYYLYPSRADGVDVELVVKSAYKLELNMAHFKKREKILTLIKRCYFQNVTIP